MQKLSREPGSVAVRGALAMALGRAAWPWVPELRALPPLYESY